MIRVLLFNTTGERDSAAMLKLLEVSTTGLGSDTQILLSAALFCSSDRNLTFEQHLKKHKQIKP